MYKHTWLLASNRPCATASLSGSIHHSPFTWSNLLSADAGAGLAGGMMDAEKVDIAVDALLALCARGGELCALSCECRD